MANSGRTDKCKYKYKNNTRVRKGNSSSLDVDMKGFLCSCNNREKECVRESYNVLNKYADLLYGTTTSEKESDTSKSDSVEDIEGDLAKEIQALKEDKIKGKHRFQSLKSGAKNLIFISTTLEYPTELAQKIVADVHENKIQQTRYLIRLVPIETTCKAHLKNIEKSFEPLAEKHFKNEARSFSVVYNHRMNDSLSKDEVIKMVADKVMATRSDHKVNLKEADISIVIEVIRSIVLIGVVTNYLKYKKYNLLVTADSGSGVHSVDDVSQKTEQKLESHSDVKCNVKDT